jgi:hypothetical protein
MRVAEGHHVVKGPLDDVTNSIYLEGSFKSLDLANNSNTFAKLKTKEIKMGA